LPFDTIAPKGKNRYLYKKFATPLVPQELLRVHKSRVATTPFAFAYKKENLPYFKDQYKSLDNSLFTNLIDSSYADEQVGELNHREYLRMYFLAKKMQ
jgi:hypothetical protein